MRARTAFLVVAAMLATFTLSINSAQADMFGTSGNEFTIDFVNIGNAGNAADTTGYGAVPYAYRVGTYEITQDAIDKATASGMSNVTAGAWTGNQPAANISWYEAAAFVNWLNTSTGNQAAYNLTFSGSWSMTLWSSADAWTAGGTDLYRHKDAFYFLPSENEWYKAAYYNQAAANYFDYPTGSDAAPVAVANGTTANTAVYDSLGSGPAGVNDAGGLSPYGTMGQGGNVWEWMETATNGNNSSPTENRVLRGASWSNSPPIEYMQSSYRSFFSEPSGDNSDLGFRVASVPEPSTYAILLMTGAGALWWARRQR